MKTFKTEFVIPWVRMRAEEERIRKAAAVETPEPFAARHSVTYFNNRKQERRIADTVPAYDRSRDMTPFDPAKPRCDRAKPSLLWAEIFEENRRHVVPMTTAQSHGRPNRVQIDRPMTEFCRSREIHDSFYRRNDLNLVADAQEFDVDFCAL